MALPADIKAGDIDDLGCAEERRGIRSSILTRSTHERLASMQAGKTAGPFPEVRNTGLLLMCSSRAVRTSPALETGLGRLRKYQMALTSTAAGRRSERHLSFLCEYGNASSDLAGKTRT